MEKAELVSTLTALVDRYGQHQQYIDKARSQIGKFSAAVIEKVVLDHSVKASSVADEVAPLLPALQEHIQGLEQARRAVMSGRGGVDEEIQEYDLRLAIGEIEQADYDTAVGALKASVEQSEGKLSEIDAGLAELTGLRERWAAFGNAVPASAPAPEPEPEPEPDEPSTPIVATDEMAGAFVTRAEIRDDVSAVFPNGTPILKIEEEVVAIETSEISDDEADGPSADVPFGFDDEAGDIDLVGGNEPAPAGEVEVEISAEPAPAAAQPPATGAAAAETQRRALLLYQEGTAEEQIYPFTGDTLTIGRGRENDIQIKNDSKVSRYHCKLTRRQNAFYIEDIKSSNGTLVNGELITDRRLFGGEEVIIGETFFRFRIME